MQITAFTVDWSCIDDLHHGLWWLDERGRGKCDPFTTADDSFATNSAFAAWFRAVRPQLEPAHGEVLQRFLVNCCFNLWIDNPPPDYDLPERLDWVYAALEPRTVRERLAGWMNVDLFELCRQEIPSGYEPPEFDGVPMTSAVEIQAFITRWCSAHGIAAALGRGLVVVCD